MYEQLAGPDAEPSQEDTELLCKEGMKALEAHLRSV